MSCRNLLGLPDRRPIFPDRLETESGIPCVDPGSGGSFGRMAEQSRLTGCEPKNLIEISSQHTPINHLSRRNSFSTNLDDVPTSAASDATDTLDAGITSPLLTQERKVNPVSLCPAASSSKRQQHPAAASPNGTNHSKMSNVGSCGELQLRGDTLSGVAGNCDGAIAQMLKSMLKGKRDREHLAVCRPKNKTNSCLRNKKNP